MDCHKDKLNLFLHLIVNLKKLFYEFIEQVPELKQKLSGAIQTGPLEGFGLPLVESMAAGVPLITSKSSCIPEIVGNGGLIVNTKDYIELSK